MFTPNQQPPVQEVQTLEVTHTIAQLAAMYEVGKPWKIDQDIVIGGKVSTNDHPNRQKHDPALRRDHHITKRRFCPRRGRQAARDGAGKLHHHNLQQ